MAANARKQNMPVEFTIDHVGISVSDLDRSTVFYAQILGFTCERIIEMPDGSGKIALLQKPGFTIEMFQIKGAFPLPEDRRMPIIDLKTQGVKHFALRVKDISQAADYLKQENVEFITEPAMGVRGFKRFFIKDPDGIGIELTEGPARE